MGNLSKGETSLMIFLFFRIEIMSGCADREENLFDFISLDINLR